MPFDSDGSAPADLSDLARRGTPDQALVGLGTAVMGRRGYLASAGYTLRGADALPVLDRSGQPAVTVAEVPDRVLESFGLVLVSVPGSPAVMADAALPALMLRIGLLGWILDTAYDHLKPRVSFGRKTLTHQLVKAGFAEAYGTLLLLREKSLLRAAAGEMNGIESDHAELSGAETQAEKLMGGHGYLIGATHGIAYLSMVVRSLYGRAAV